MANVEPITEKRLRAIIQDEIQKEIKPMAKQVELNSKQGEKITKSLYGNGEPGIDEQIRILQRNVKELGEKLKDWTTVGKWFSGIVGTYVIVEVLKFLLANI